MGINNQDELEAAFGDVNKGLRYTEPNFEDYESPRVNTTRKALELLESQAAMFERLADSAQVAAKHNLEQAVRYRMKAAEVRERLTTEKV